MPKRRGRYPLRAHKDLVLAALVAGATQAEIARKYEVTVQAVSYFVGQHADELVRLTREAQERVRDVAIAEVEERVRRKAALLARMDTVLEERGIMASEPRWIGGEYGREVSVERFDAPLVNAYRELLDSVGDDLGQKPRRPAITVHDNRKQVIVSLQTLEELADAADAER